MSDETPLHSVAVAGVVVDAADRVLLIRRRDTGDWQPPGGVLELDERFEDGVVREVLEETGVQVRVERLTGVYKNLVRGVVVLVYRCHAVGGGAQASEEAAEVAWVDLDEVWRRLVPAFAARVRDAVAPAGTAVPSRAHDGVELR